MLHLNFEKNSAEFTLSCLFVLAGLRSNDDRWLQLNFRKPLSSPETLSPITINYLNELLTNHLPTSVYQNKFGRLLRILQNKTDSNSCGLISLCNHWRWRDVPLPVWKILKLWHLNNQQLILHFDIPTPSEVLEMQIQGKRCVSVFCDAKKLNQVHEHHRDAFLFTIHDLEHAWKFISQPELFYYQIQWARMLHSAFAQGPWKSYIDVRLVNQYNYLISDMNTHPWHAFLSLKHLWLQSYKLKQNNGMREKLLMHEENAFIDSWNRLLDFWQISRLHTLNSAEQVEYFLSHLKNLSSH